MAVVRRGAAPPPSSSESSSDEEDAFTAISRGAKKKNKKKGLDSRGGGKSNGGGAVAPAAASVGAPADTSSNRRHHHVSSERQAKMEALLQELKEAEQELQKSGRSGDAVAGHYGPGSGDRPPLKRGSYCERGEEMLTTNIFVGNLHPATTEEELTEIFRQFGDLYSVKIMWPRTDEERARNRNTGFVCFMERDDAQEAMDALNETDPLGMGRFMRLGWGKNVKMSVKRGTGGVPIAPICRKQSKLAPQERHQEEESQPSHQRIDDGGRGMSERPRGGDLGLLSDDPPRPQNKSSSYPIYDPSIHASDAIRVVSPSNHERYNFISTVASFVAKDGSILEEKLAEREGANHKFSFLSTQGSMQERIFYRWRVYSFAQGDGLDSWRTEPFVMFSHHGRFWIPPVLDHDAAAKELAEAEIKEDEIRSMQAKRRKLNDNKNFMTGRQLEHAKFGGGRGTAKEGAAKLSEGELAKFHDLLRKKLCQSRDSICEAMAFCFEKSGAAKEISGILNEALLEDGPSISPETRISRLFLVSDILFNSQQPGVKNAYLYRDAIEGMSPEIFSSLGNHRQGSAGRMTMNKLRNAVSTVLTAWANWSVYNTTFLDELKARFEGQEKEKEVDINGKSEDSNLGECQNVVSVGSVDKPQHITLAEAQKGDWSETQLGRESLDGVDVDVDGQPLSDDDVDGESLAEDDVDGEALGRGDV